MESKSNLGGLLGKSSRLLANQFNNDLTPHNLTVEQWSLLVVLWTKDAQKQKDLQAALLKDKATINSLVSYLMKNGFVFKKRNLSDKRSFIISLTPKGKIMKEVTIPLAMQNIDKATEGIDKHALKTTLTVLDQIIKNLTKERS